MPREQRLRLMVAFASVYLIWGSTYLAIRFAIETIPPFFMAAARFLLAGAILLVWARLRGAAWPERIHWRTGLIIGGLLLLGGNGGVVWAEQRVASSLAALLVGAEPLWAVLLDWARPGGPRPSPVVGLGLLTGFAGVVLLAAPTSLAGGEPIDPLGTAALMAATISWAIGSIHSRSMPAPSSPLMSTAVNMLGGSALLFLAGLGTGEVARLDLASLSTRSVVSLLYLVVFGAVIGFTAYLWLLRNTTLARASTYAYVNPVVALFLGWLLGGEPITARTLLAAAVIVAGVVTITVGQYAQAGVRRLLERGGASTLPSSVPGEPT
jgi:drug/metabolite transporter (DMT)-like permease